MEKLRLASDEVDDYRQEEMSTTVCVRVPCELIFTEDYLKTGAPVEGWTDAWFKHNRRWSGLPIGRLWPHQRLYRFFRGNGDDSPAAYLDWFNNIFRLRGLASPHSDADIVHERYELFRKWDRLLWTYGPFHSDFLLDANFDAQRGIFMLKDGHHRSAFLRNTGVRQISLRVPATDKAAWLDNDASRHVRNVISTQQRTEFYTPIHHPDFYDLSAYRETNYRGRLDHILEFLGPMRIPGRLLDIGSNTGYFSHHFAREGVEVVGYEPDRSHRDLADALSRLYRLTVRFENRPFEEADPERFSGALLLTVLYHIIALGRHEAFLARLDQTVDDFVIWESGSEPEEEKRVITRLTKFSHYRKIANTYGTGRVREMGIFMTSEFANALDSTHAMIPGNASVETQAAPVFEKTPPHVTGGGWRKWFNRTR
jgi:hypothetical protein